MKAEDLKNSILQLAMQGKLVPQDSNDEPASILLDKINQEKEKLINNKIIKKTNKQAIISKKDGHYYEKIGKKGEEVCIDDKLFDIPDSWIWCTLGDLFYCTSGLSYKKTLLNDKSDKMVRILRGGNINNEKYEFKDNDIFISEEHVKPELYLKKNTLITPAVSSLEQTGKIARIDKDFNSVVVGGFVLMLHPFLVDETFSKFYLNMLASDFHRSNCRSITRKSGQAFYNLSRAKLLNLPIILPPLNEQRRIVTKIEELLPLLDKYGVNEVKLAQLNSELPTKLKSSILQEAVQGKLIPQNPNDEPASVLLENIKQEKEQLIKAKKIKKNNKESTIYKEDDHYYEQIGKKEPVCIDDEIPFDIPESWEWCRLENIVELINGDRGKNYPAKSKLSTVSGIPFISAINLSHNGIKQDNLYFLSQEQYDLLSRGKLKKNDLIFCLRGSLGKNSIFDLDKGAIASSLVILRRYTDDIFLKYLFYYINSSATSNEIRKYDNGTAQPNLAASSLKKFFVPIPPLNEQKRIVAKIEQLFDNVDVLIDE